MTNDWKIYKAEFSIDPSHGVMVSSAYFVAKDIQDILSRMSQRVIPQLRTLNAVDDEFQEFVLIRPDTVPTPSVELGSMNSELHTNSIYEVNVVDESGSTRLIYTNSLEWLTTLTSKIVGITMKYENVHILWESEEAK
ncbi:MAG: hypothetical protein JHC28_03385 [Thermoprotei archaeon]|nr:hypothetical protein [Thermoprotei archaeon]